jgi:hypothetical protein
MDGLDREHTMRISNIKDYRNGDGTAGGRQAATSPLLSTYLTLHSAT